MVDAAGGLLPAQGLAVAPHTSVAAASAIRSTPNNLANDGRKNNLKSPTSSKALTPQKSFNQYQNLAAQAVRGALKQELKDKALVRDKVQYRVREWKDGQRLAPTNVTAITGTPKIA